MRKGQAAMEFLMTYGWAILVVLVAIGALAYFGVLSPSKFLPKSCTLEPGLSCEDFKATTNSVQLIMRNGRGEDLSNVDVSVQDCTTADANADGDDTWSDGATLGGTGGITVTGCSNFGTAGSRVKKSITITYTTASGINHTASGEFTGKIEA